MIVDVFFIVMYFIVYFTESLILELATRVQKSLKEQEGSAGGFKFSFWVQKIQALFGQLDLFLFFSDSSPYPKTKKIFGLLKNFA